MSLVGSQMPDLDPASREAGRSPYELLGPLSVYSVLPGFRVLDGVCPRKSYQQSDPRSRAAYRKGQGASDLRLLPSDTFRLVLPLETGL